MSMKEITYEESLQLNGAVYIDVRAPIEFAQDHIPGAVNVPIFDDGQRKEIGTLYRAAGRDTAIIRGTEIVGGKLRSILEDVKKHSDREIVIYCARGGMRSRSLAGLLDSLGMPVYRLLEGYKGYRGFVNRYFEELEKIPPVFVLQGLTGAGKTLVLHEIQNSIDLEGMAGHRSSIFGAVGLEQRSQKYFESQLLKRLRDLKGEQYIVIEGESQKIGNLHIPDRLFRIMRNSPAILIDTGMEKRIDIIVDEYSESCTEDIIKPLVTSLMTKIGRTATEELLTLFQEGNLREFTRILLEDYYDPRYLHTLKDMKFLAEVENTGPAETALKVVEIIKNEIINFT